jgi:energy-coupling factor transport system permease protein
MNGGMNTFHPAVPFFFYAGGAVLIMVARHPVFLAAILLVLIGHSVVMDYGRTLRRWWGAIVLMSGFFLVITPLVNRRGTHILFYFNGRPVLEEAVYQGVMTALSLAALLVLFLNYNQVITPEKFLFLFGKLPQWALVATLAVRFVPELQRRLGDIQTVQRARGLSVTAGPLQARLKNGLALVQMLLTLSLEEALQTADSMKARGYGTGKRSQYNPYRFRPADRLALLFLAAVFGLALFGWRLGDLVLTLRPVLEPVFLHGREWFYLFVVGIYYVFPLFIEGREAWRWRSWK